MSDNITEKPIDDAACVLGGDKSQEVPDITMEKAFARLNEVLDKMENGELPLEEVFTLYQEGLKLVRLCEGKIDRIEKKLKVLNEGGQL